jgi:penicillin-binding protein 1A
VPEGVVSVGGNWMYEDYTNGGGISTLGSGGDGSDKASNAMPPAEERNRILDLFRN